MTHRFLRILAVICSLAALAIALTPAFIRWRVRAHLSEKYPDVSVTSIEPHWKYVELRGVTFKRSWAFGQAELVSVPWDDNGEITVSGGEVSVDYEKYQNRPKSTSDEPARKIRGSGIAGIVTYGETTASFVGLNFTREAASAPHVTLNHPKLGLVKLGDVSFEDQKIKIASTSVKTIEFSGNALGEVSLKSIAIDPKSRVISIGDVSVPKYGTSVKMLDASQEGKLYVFRMGELKIENLRLALKPITFANVDVAVDPAEGIARFRRDGAPFVTLDVKKQAIFGEAECSTWTSLIPPEIKVDTIQDLSFSGKLSFDLKTQPKVDFTFASTCKAKCDAAIFKSLRKMFTYPIRKADGSNGTRDMGPNVAGWTPLGAVSRHVVTALLTMEDPGFNTHKGFIRQAIENSIRDDLKVGRFVRGGSTLTMQLAKNIWLSHEKTIGRKVQEAFLTMALEGCLSKEEILALYVNVVEFGPGLYGIGPAARHYFKVPPSELTPEEAFYLVYILPRPRTSPPPNAATMAKVKSLMAQFAKQGRIPDLLGEEGPIDSSGWESGP